MYGRKFGPYPGGGWYEGRGPGWGKGRGWGWEAGWAPSWTNPRFFRPRGWCWQYLFNEREYLQAEKDAVEKYLEMIKERLEELDKESNKERQL